MSTTSSLLLLILTLTLSLISANSATLSSAGEKSTNVPITISTLKPVQHQPNTEVANEVRQMPLSESNDFPCITCNLVLGGVLAAVKHNATLEKIEQLLHSLCHDVSFCDHFVAKIISILPYLARLAESQDYNAKDMCGMLNYCDVNCCLTETTPEQIHLGLNEHERASVAWTTKQRGCSEVQLKGIAIDVTSGKESVVYEESIKGFERTYTNGGWRGWMHFVRDMGPSTLVHQTASGDPVTHHYRVGCSEQNTWSQWFDMRSGASDARNVVVVGDMGMENSDDNLKRIQQHIDNIDLIIIVGDQSYADGNQRKWDEFLRKFEPIFARRPLITVTGNHENAIIGLPVLNITGYPHRFLLPNIDMSTIPVGQGSAWYYSFNFGPIHFVGVDSEGVVDLPLITDEQLSFIDADLHKVNRAETPFVVVMSHRPFYCTQAKGTLGACDDSQMGYMRGRAESLFEKHEVDLVISGHRHNLERSEIIYKRGTNDEFVIPYIVNGAGGNRENMQHFGNSPPDYSKFRLTDEHGYAFLGWNDNATALSWQQFTAEKDVLVDAIQMQRRR
eukprot:CAMPEP_0117450382 /NCGR_PEP_ID=MMETSP0759-20121206/8439_1 /TAXON_ID=63605 /ORGANISM="Percolomonas cosmopolitus, Strain WS" /LENGTH=560 /DNA_ID=CAMNT_0005242901 /DNA_START=47 /DNA_END=1729 /DNA_ORIENTATION=-